MFQGRILICVLVLLFGASIALLQLQYKPDVLTRVIVSGQSAFREALTGKQERMPSMPVAITDCPACPVIGKITLSPKEPTVLDNINATMELDREVSDIRFEYRWFVNDKPVENITGDLLPAGSFKKRDAVSVKITPYLNLNRGNIAQSNVIVIYSAPPSLTLKEGSAKVGDIIELQVVGIDPDGDKITYALEEPRLDGMSVDSATGKIIWSPSKKEAGIYKFGASATDVDGAKVTHVFEFRLGPQ